MTIAAALAHAVPARAQSLTSGTLAGAVRDASGAALPEATVTLIDQATGVRRQRDTGRDGAYQFTLLLPGQYELSVERFGYRPQLIQRVPLGAGSTRQLDVVLAQGAAEAVDSTTFRGAPPGGARYALTGGAASDDFAALADARGFMTGVGWVLPQVSGDLESEGLPGRLGALALDGVTRWSPRHPRLPGADLDALAFPTGGVREVGLLQGGFDAEWPGSGGGVLSGFAVPGARTVGAQLTADASGDGQRGTLLLSGPIVRDTAYFAAGLAARHLSVDLPEPWGSDSTSDSLAQRVVAIAQDSFQTDLGAYTRPYRSTADIVSGFTRVDWLIARDQRVSVRASGETGTLDDPDLGPTGPVALGSSLKTRDLSFAAALSSAIGPLAASELRVSLDAGERTYDRPELPRTIVMDGGFAAGAAEVSPGTFRRTTFRVSETGHLRFSRVALKAGVAVTLDRHNDTYADDRAGTFYFADTLRLAQLNGAFRQAAGISPAANFQTTAVAGFVQGLLQPSPSFELLLGLRYEAMRLPVSDVRRNTAWLGATGLDNTGLKSQRSGVAPRLALTWMLGQRRQWMLQGGTGIFFDPADAGVLAEAIARASGAVMRRGFGALGRWPALPDTSVAPDTVVALTILGPEYRPPRTGRAELSLAGNVGGTVLRIGGEYRHTDYLPVRRDLNLPVSPTSRDQFGRTLYGTLVQSGSLLGASRGTNRRFGAFDEVLALDPTGASDYWSMTIGLERAVSRGLSLMASYTYSHTTDNWFGARAGTAEAQILPLTDSTGRSTWAKGTSDFDVPHRLVVGAELRASGRLGLRLAVLYRYRSGYPFTPGFRDGVDANADGSARNDPAFVSDTVSGAMDVIALWPCLGSQIGRFAGRNSCREKSVGALDLRLAATLMRFGRTTTDLVIDGLNLVHTDEGIVDRALYLVDGTRSLATNVTTGVTTVPLVANANFGRLLARRTVGAAWRAGLKVSF